MFFWGEMSPFIKSFVIFIAIKITGMILGILQNTSARCLKMEVFAKNHKNEP
jgi:hypothetical protein